MDTSSPDPFQISPAVHVAVTGHRFIPASDVERITSQVHEVLKSIQGAAHAIFRDYSEFFSHYQVKSAPKLRLITPLAEGADRLGAREALSLGYELQCPLPFARGYYEGTFEETDAEHREFRELLSRAQAVFELAAGNERATSQGYADVSKVLINHADILVAIWDGGPGKYIAGTFATMTAALNHHVPVVIIPVSPWQGGGDIPPILYKDGIQAEPSWQASIHAHLMHVMLPQKALAEKTGEKNMFPRPSPLPKATFEWQGFIEKCMLKKAPAKKAGQKQPPAEMPPLAGTVWQQRKKCASAWVASYGSRYRNAILGRQFFPLLATVFLTLALYCPQFPFILRIGAIAGCSPLTVKLIFYTLQIICIFLSLYLVFRDRKAQYHRSFFSYRVMAELCRQTSFLYPVGFCNVGYSHRVCRKEKGESEVAWFYHMLLRTDGLPHCTVTRDDLRKWLMWIDQQFIQSQHGYHAKRMRRCATLQNTIGFLVMIFFVSGVLATLCRAGLDLSSWKGLAAVFATLALIFPPAAVFFASLSNNSGYPVHYGISNNMQDFFSSVHEDIQSLLNQPEHEISYSDILRICNTINEHCRDELSDWEDTIHSRSLKWV